MDLPEPVKELKVTFILRGTDAYFFQEIASNMNQSVNSLGKDITKEWLKRLNR